MSAAPSLDTGTQNMMMNTALDNALSKLASLPTPTPGKAPSVTVNPPIQDHSTQSRRHEDESKDSERAQPEDEQEVKQTGHERVAEVPEPEKPVAKSPDMWGPHQSKALHEVLQSNADMEREIKDLRDKAAKYESAIDDARYGDLASFAKKTEVPEEELLEGLRGGKEITKPYVRRLEGTVGQLSAKLEALEKQLQERDTRTKNESELASINSTLDKSDGYSILKQIPDAAQRVQRLIRSHDDEARNRGEVTPALSVEKAASQLKEEFVSTLKRLVNDETVRRELGLGESVQPANVKPRSKKAITSQMSSQGSAKPKTVGYDANEQLMRALKAVSS